MDQNITSATYYLSYLGQFTFFSVPQFLSKDLKERANHNVNVVNASELHTYKMVTMVNIMLCVFHYFKMFLI